MQFENALAARMPDPIAPRTLLDELKRMAVEPSSSEVLAAIDRDGLMELFSPVVRGTQAEPARPRQMGKRRGPAGGGEYPVRAAPGCLPARFDR